MKIFNVISVIKTKYFVHCQAKPFLDINEASNYFNNETDKYIKEYKSKFGLGVNITKHENNEYVDEFMMCSITGDIANVRLEEHNL